MVSAPASDPILPRTLAAVVVPKRVKRVLEGLWQTLSSELRGPMQVTTHEAELELGRMAEQSRGTPAETAYLASLHALRQHGAGLVSHFLEAVEAELVNLHAPRVSRRFEGVPVASHGWSLVEATELDEGSVLAAIASRADSRNSLVLQLMGHRFGVLAGAPAFDAEHLPLGPHSLCHALRNACAALPLEARLVVIKQFGKVGMAQLPTLLETLNERLVSEGVLPHLHFVPVRRRSASTGTARDESGNTPTQAGHGDPDRAGTAGLAPLPPAPAAGPQTPSDEEFATLQDLLARRRALLSKLRTGGNEERLRELLGHHDVLGSLRRMRAGAGKDGTPRDIRQTLLAQARQAHGYGVALGDADSDGFELYDLFMAQLRRELRSGSPGEALIERLKLPLLQLALRDHRFFVNADHPARQLLDAVSLAGARWLGEDDLDPQWLGLLQRAVGMVEEDPDAGDETFVAANHALQGGLQVTVRKYEMTERRHVEAARGREKLELARLRASREIGQLVAGRKLPRFHSLLLEQAWTDVLSLVLLRSGEESEAWREMHEVTAAIVAVGIGGGEQEPDPELLAKLQDALAQMGYHAEDVGAIARQLAHGRADDDDSVATRTELVVQLKARARLGEDALANSESTLPPRNSVEQAAFARLGALDDGCWIDLHDTAQNSVVRRRLAWTSARSGHALLLNRRSLRIDGDDLDALARKLADGRLQVVEDVHPAELAWQATLTSLHRIAGDQANGGGAK